MVGWLKISTDTAITRGQH